MHVPRQVNKASEQASEQGPAQKEVEDCNDIFFLNFFFVLFTYSKGFPL